MSPSSSPPASSGIDAIVEMLQHMEAPEQEKLLANLAARDPDLVQKLRERMFTFQDLLSWDGPSLQILLREVPQTLLALALRTEEEPNQTVFLKNISLRAADAVRDEIRTAGPRKLSDVREAQKKIVSIAKELIQKGSVVIKNQKY